MPFLEGSIMKMKLIALIILFFSAANSHAMQSLSCREIGSGPDNGYRIQVSANLDKALIEVTTIAGTHTIANLDCSRSQEQPLPENEHVIIDCYEPSIRDAGYSLVIFSGGATHQILGELFAVNFAGDKKIAELSCQ